MTESEAVSQFLALVDARAKTIVLERTGDMALANPSFDIDPNADLGYTERQEEIAREVMSKWSSDGWRRRKGNWRKHGQIWAGGLRTAARERAELASDMLIKRAMKAWHNDDSSVIDLLMVEWPKLWSHQWVSHDSLNAFYDALDVVLKYTTDEGGVGQARVRGLPRPPLLRGRADRQQYGVDAVC